MLYYIYIHIYIYIYYPLYINWPITSADLPHVIIQYILYLICQKLYWTVSGSVQYRIYWTVSKRGYRHSAHAVPTHQSSVNVLNENIINISPFAENIEMFSHMLIFIVNNVFNIGWLTVQYRLYWTQISYIGLGCASSNIAFFVQYNLYWTVNHPILYNIRLLGQFMKIWIEILQTQTFYSI